MARPKPRVTPVMSTTFLAIEHLCFAESSKENRFYATPIYPGRAQNGHRSADIAVRSRPGVLMRSTVSQTRRAFESCCGQQCPRSGGTFERRSKAECKLPGLSLNLGGVSSD